MWNDRYEELLKEWYDLRQAATLLPIEDALHLIDDWWARAPIVNYQLHIADYEEWPLPWDLLAEHAFCDIGICLGKAYTLLLSDIEIQSMIIGQSSEDTYLEIIINDTKFILTNENGAIMSTIDKSLITHKIDCKFLTDKII